MCFDDGARVPVPPVRGGATDQVDLVLTSADGTRFMAYAAHPDAPPANAAGVIVLPDVRGLHQYYKDLAGRFAEAGRHAIAIDYFGRTAGIGPRPDDFPYREHVDQIDPARLTEDVGAAVEYLRSPGRSLYTVGFCFGGSLSWRQSAGGHGLAGCIGFYGRPSRADDVVGQMTAPLLLLAAGQDFTPVSETEAFAQRVRAEAGVAAEVHVYPDAPHSFFDKRFAEYQAECDDAWRRMLAFTAPLAG